MAKTLAEALKDAGVAPDTIVEAQLSASGWWNLAKLDGAGDGWWGLRGALEPPTWFRNESPMYSGAVRPRTDLEGPVEPR